MSARDELAELIQDVGEYIPGSHADDYVSPAKAADAILAAGYRKPRTVTTIEEINSLADGSIIESHSGQLGRTQRHTISSLDGGGVHLGKLDMAPATVLYESEAS